MCEPRARTSLTFYHTDSTRNLKTKFVVGPWPECKQNLTYASPPWNSATAFGKQELAASNPKCLAKTSPCGPAVAMCLLHNNKLQLRIACPKSARAPHKRPHQESNSNMFPPSNSTSPLPTTANRRNKSSNGKRHIQFSIFQYVLNK